MNKKFLVTFLKNMYSEMNDRIYTLLDKYKLEGNILSTVESVERDIDCKDVNLKLKNDRCLRINQMCIQLK
jgi:hypothetical protein